MLFIAYTFPACVCRMSENYKSLVLQDKCNIEIFLSPVTDYYIYTLISVIHLHFWAYGPWDSLFPISMSPTANL